MPEKMTTNDICSTIWTILLPRIDETPAAQSTFTDKCTSSAADAAVTNPPAESCWFRVENGQLVAKEDGEIIACLEPNAIEQKWVTLMEGRTPAPPPEPTPPPNEPTAPPSEPIAPPPIEPDPATPPVRRDAEPPQPEPPVGTDSPPPAEPEPPVVPTATIDYCPPKTQCVAGIPLYVSVGGGGTASTHGLSVDGASPTVQYNQFGFFRANAGVWLTPVAFTHRWGYRTNVGLDFSAGRTSEATGGDYVAEISSWDLGVRSAAEFTMAVGDVLRLVAGPTLGLTLGAWSTDGIVSTDDAADQAYRTNDDRFQGHFLTGLKFGVEFLAPYVTVGVNFLYDADVRFGTGESAANAAAGTDGVVTPDPTVNHRLGAELTVSF